MTRSYLWLLGRWVTARVRLTLRNPRATVFTFVFPLMFLMPFNALNSNTRVDAPGPAGDKIAFAQFYTPSIGVFGLALACYSGLIFGVAQARESGLLKRVRGTPLPMWIYLSSWLTGAALTGIGSVLLMFVVAVPVFGVDIYPRMLPAAGVTLVVSAARLGALGLAVESLVRTADQAMPVAQLTLLPLSFISGVFYPLNSAPEWLVRIAHFFPLSHIVEAFDACFAPQTPGGGWLADDLVSIAIWGLVALAVAARRFRWEPTTGERGVRRRILATRY
jgi:ABC-2 type transport system permease protein